MWRMDLGNNENAEVFRDLQFLRSRWTVMGPFFFFFFFDTGTHFDLFFENFLHFLNAHLSQIDNLIVNLAAP